MEEELFNNYEDFENQILRINNQLKQENQKHRQDELSVQALMNQIKMVFQPSDHNFQNESKLNLVQDQLAQSQKAAYSAQMKFENHFTDQIQILSDMNLKYGQDIELLTKNLNEAQTEARQEREKNKEFLFTIQQLENMVLDHSLALQDEQFQSQQKNISFQHIQQENSILTKQNEELQQMLKQLQEKSQQDSKIEEEQEMIPIQKEDQQLQQNYIDLSMKLQQVEQENSRLREQLETLTTQQQSSEKQAEPLKQENSKLTQLLRSTQNEMVVLQEKIQSQQLKIYDQSQKNDLLSQHVTNLEKNTNKISQLSELNQQLLAMLKFHESLVKPTDDQAHLIGCFDSFQEMSAKISTLPYVIKINQDLNILIDSTGFELQSQQNRAHLMIDTFGQGLNVTVEKVKGFQEVLVNNYSFDVDALF